MRYILLFILISFSTICSAQLSAVTEILKELNKDSLIRFGNELTGKKSVVINGDTTFIKSRNANSASNVVSKKYLVQKLKSYGLNSVEQDFDFTGNNVYAMQKGNVDPKKYWIICAHYDDRSIEGSPAGADDNASGTSAVLEIARVLSTKAFPYTIIYALWDNEEENLNGSRYFVENNPVDFDHIQGVINLDMIGYDSDSDKIFEIHVRDVGNSAGIGQNIVKINKDYKIDLVPNTINPGNGSSDQAAFWQGRIPAIAFYEDGNDFNPRYHRLSDSIYYLNKDYWFNLTKLACASIATFATNGQPVGIIENASTSLEEITISPNPFTDKLQITFNNSPGKTAQVSIFNILGKKSGEYILEIKSSDKQEFHLQTMDLPNGIYLCKIEIAGKISTFKLIHND